MDGPNTAAEMEALFAEVEAAVRESKEAVDRREAVQDALHALDVWPHAHVWVPEEGDEDIAYVLAGKTSKIGKFIVIPGADTSAPDERPYCFGERKYCSWEAFRMGVRTRAQDFSGRGNLNYEVELFVPKGLLSAGVYGVDEDDEGQFFFPVIHHDAEGVEVVPLLSAIRKVRPKKAETQKQAAKTSAAPQTVKTPKKERPTEDALQALRQKWAK